MSQATSGRFFIVSSPVHSIEMRNVSIIAKTKTKKNQELVQTRNRCSAAALIICSSTSGCQGLNVSRMPTLTVLPVVNLGSQPGSLVCVQRDKRARRESRPLPAVRKVPPPPGTLQALKGRLCSVSECKFDELMRFVYTRWFNFWPF